MAAVLSQPPKVMPLPAALRYAWEGYAIRRVIWDGATDHPELAWLIYRGGVFLRLREGADPWVLQNDEITRADFLAYDWTLLPPECVSDADVCACGAGASGYEIYPVWDDEPDPLAGLDVANPNSVFGLVDCKWQTGVCECAGPEPVQDDGWFDEVTPETEPTTSTDSESTTSEIGGSGSSSGGGSSGGGSDESGGGAGGGFGGGGSSGGGGRTRRRRRPRLSNLPSVTLQAQLLDNSCIPRLPEAPCGHLNLPDYSLKTREIVGSIHLGAAPSGKNFHAQITVWCSGKNLLRTWGGPGDSFDFGPAAFRQRTGYSIPVFATVREDNETVTKKTQVQWPDLCPEEGPCPPEPDPSGSQ